jgi:hypothetical protein
MVVLACQRYPAVLSPDIPPVYYDAEKAQYVVREMNAHSWWKSTSEIGWVNSSPRLHSLRSADTSENELTQMYHVIRLHPNCSCGFDLKK